MYINNNSNFMILTILWFALLTLLIDRAQKFSFQTSILNFLATATTQKDIKHNAQV